MDGNKQEEKVKIPLSGPMGLGNARPEPSSSPKPAPSSSPAKVKRSHHKQPAPSSLPKRGAGRPPGSVNKPKPAGVPEFKVVKDAAEVNDTYAAWAHVAEHERDMVAYKKRLAERHKQLTGLDVSVPDPQHPLNAGAKRLEPSISAELAADIAGMLATVPATFGFEARPTKDAQDRFAASLVRLSRHYPDLDSKVIDWVGFAAAGLALATPTIVEIKSKRDGSWPEVRGKLVAAGMVDARPRLEVAP